MKIHVPLLLAAAFTFATSADASEEKGLGDLIRGLSSDSFQDREKATNDLWEAGPDALEILRETTRSLDPEQASRAAEVLEKIELRITPKTPESILELIRKYRAATQEQKPNILNQLKRKKAFYQVLKLYSMENPEIKALMVSSIRGVAITGARQYISVGEEEKALELLKMSAKEPNDIMALACAYRNMGYLDEGAADPPTPEGVPSELWQITLLRAKGDIAKAAKIAEESNQIVLLAGMKVLTGDPTVWLLQNGFGDEELRSLDAYTDIAVTRWQGGNPKKSDFARLQELVISEDGEDHNRAMASLAALGRLGDAEEAHAKEEPDLGFHYYISQERVDKALALLGLDPEEPNYNEWVAERFRRMDNRGDRDANAPSPEKELQSMANFMEVRGLDREFKNSFLKPLEDLAKKDEEDFLEFLRPLFLSSTGAPRLGLFTGTSWAGNDEMRWNRLLAVAFGEEDEIISWIEWIKTIDPGLSQKGVMQVMMAVFRIGEDPDHLRRKWMDKFFEAADKSPDDDRSKYLRKIVGLATATNDVASALKVWDMTKPEERGSVAWSSLGQYLSAAGRWKEAAEIMTPAGGKISSSPEFHALQAATFRKAGLEVKAAEHDRWAEKLALGYAPSCNRIGDNYLYGGDRERANKWYERAVFQADILSGEFVAVLDNYAHGMLGIGEWLIAASCYEALAQVFVSQRFSGGAISDYSKARLSADLAKALSILPKDRERAVSLLDAIHRNFSTDGILADDFFPLVREAGLDEELDRWFKTTWRTITSILSRFPNSDNTKNTAAWLASRAGKNLVEAERYLVSAIDRNPDQAAYLDTMAELQFAKGDRKDAVKWSQRAMLHYPLTDRPYDVMIRKQHERFLRAPLPSPPH